MIILEALKDKALSLKIVSNDTAKEMRWDGARWVVWRDHDEGQTSHLSEDAAIHDLTHY